MNDPFKHNSSSVKADFITSPNSDDNSYTNESQSFSEKKTETSQQNIKNKKFHFVDGQEIRERRKKISQDSQSSPSTHSASRTVNIFYQPRNVIIAFSVFISIVAVIWVMTIEPGPPSTFFEKFAGTTNDIMKDVNSIELPAANAVMEHTVACRRAANLVQKSIAFEAYGVQIAKGLREFGEKIKNAGNLLKNMYSKGSAVYVSFDIEIEAMMSRLSSTRRQLGDSKYFKERLNSLITKIREFRSLVGKTHMSIIEAEDARNNVEGFVVDGLRDAESFVVKNNCRSVGYNDADCHSIEVAKKELKVVNKILDHLYNTADHLDKMEKILKNYEDKLMDVSAELESAGKGDDDVFEVTKADLKFLKFAIDNSKACLHKFEQLSG